MQNANLEFRKIPSLEFLYEVSEDGRIVRNVKSKHQIKIVLDKHHSAKGYYTFWTNRTIAGVKKIRRHSIHVIVAECWLGLKPEGMEVDHIDRDTHNNHYSNLRYVTHAEQMKNRKLSSHIIERATANCLAYNKKISVGVILSHSYTGVVYQYNSISDAARALATMYSMDFEHMRFKLKKRRSHIYDYDVKYLNAETERRRP